MLLTASSLLPLLVAPASVAQDLDVQRLSPVGVDTHELAFDVLLDGVPRRLLLDPLTVRGEHHRLWVESSGGTRALTPAPTATFRGRIAGVPGSRVAALYRDGALTALVDGEQDWVIEPLGGLFDESGSDHAVRPFDAQHAGEHDGCGVRGLDLEGLSAPLFEGEGTVAYSSTGLPSLELALDSDYEFFVAYGSDITQTADRMELLLLFTNMLYESQAGLKFEAVETVVRTDPNAPDYPYGDLDNCRTGLYGFSPCFAPVWGVPGATHHDLLHFFSGRDILAGGVVGYALFNAPCAAGTPTNYRRWGISEDYGNLDQSIVLMSHEIGHNMGLFHQDGTHIMSALLSGSFDFTPSHITQLGSKIQQLQGNGCIDTTIAPTVPPVLTSLSPAVVEPRAGTVLHLFGQGLDNVFEVDVFGQTISVRNIDRISSTEIAILLPDPFQQAVLGANPVLVRNGGGEDTIDLQVVEVPALEINADAFFNLVFAGALGGAGDVCAFGYGLDSAVIDFGTWTILADWNPLSIVTLDAVGLSGPVNETFDSSMIGVTIYMQGISTDGVFRSSTDPLEVILD